MPTKRDTVPFPTCEAVTEAYSSQNEMTGFAASIQGQLLFLNVAFRSGGLSTVSLDPTHADYLLKLLKEFLPNRGDTEGSPVRWATGAAPKAIGDWFRES